MWEVNDDVISVMHEFIRNGGERGNVVCAAGVRAGLSSQIRFINVDASNTENCLRT